MTWEISALYLVNNLGVEGTGVNLFASGILYTGYFGMGNQCFILSK